ncbi:MAG: hypothetical protein ACM3QS_16385, partial [Bacteroidota bacterium]
DRVKALWAMTQYGHLGEVARRAGRGCGVPQAEGVEDTRMEPIDDLGMQENVMPGPIIFISRNRIKEGRAADFRQHYADSLPVTRTEKPRTSAQLAYENEQATEVVIVRLFADADALDLQLQGASERSKKTYEFIEPLSIEIMGTPNPATVELMRKIAGSGIAVQISASYLGGFSRLSELQAASIAPIQGEDHDAAI